MASMMVVPMHLVGGEALVTGLADCLRRTFHVTVEVRAPWFEPDLALDDGRDQYNANALLGQLLTAADGDGAKILGVIGRDLFAPALTYVFGEAQFNGRAAIVSTRRLGGVPSGPRADDGRLHERLQKEAVHEIGHTYGLAHCHDGACVMHFSMWPEQIDLKSARFCLRCLRVVTAHRL